MLLAPSVDVQRVAIAVARAAGLRYAAYSAAAHVPIAINNNNNNITHLNNNSGSQPRAFLVTARPRTAPIRALHQTLRQLDCKRSTPCSSSPASATSTTTSTCSSSSAATLADSAAASTDPWARDFWRGPGSAGAWQQARINTLRCLAGCSLGDFSAMFYLSSQHPELGVGTIMAVSMAAGIATSLAVETAALMAWNGFGLAQAGRTAFGMSMISMLTMEATENAIDWGLTGGAVDLAQPWFWGSLALSMLGGFLAPLPYNYYQLRRHGRSCH